MNHRPRHEDLPPDLVALAAALDRLGALERDSMPDRLEGSVADASVAAHVASRVELLAEADRLSAPPTLEDDVFDASAPALRPAPPLRLATDQDRHRIVLRQRRLLAAAAVALIGAGALTAVLMRPSPAPPSGGGAPTALAGTEPGMNDDVEQTVLSLLASIERTTLGGELDSLASEAEDLSPSTVSEPPLASRLINGAM